MGFVKHKSLHMHARGWIYHRRRNSLLSLHQRRVPHLQVCRQLCVVCNWHNSSTHLSMTLLVTVTPFGLKWCAWLLLPCV